MIASCKSHITNFYYVLRIYQEVFRFNVSMHVVIRVHKFKSFQKLIYVTSNEVPFDSVLTLLHDFKHVVIIILKHQVVDSFLFEGLEKLDNMMFFLYLRCIFVDFLDIGSA
jgi:hypothetical protein